VPIFRLVDRRNSQGAKGEPPVVYFRYMVSWAIKPDVHPPSCSVGPADRALATDEATLELAGAAI
jgi:hypothetical protein